MDQRSPSKTASSTTYSSVSPPSSFDNAALDQLLQSTGAYSSSPNHSGSPTTPTALVQSRPGSYSIGSDSNVSPSHRSESPAGVRRKTKVVIRETSTRTSFKQPNSPSRDGNSFSEYSYAGSPTRVITATTEVIHPDGHAERPVEVTSFKEINDIAEDLKEYTNWCSSVLGGTPSHKGHSPSPANTTAIASAAPAPSLGQPVSAEVLALQAQLQQVTSNVASINQEKQQISPSVVATSQQSPTYLVQSNHLHQDQPDFQQPPPIQPHKTQTVESQQSLHVHSPIKAKSPSPGPVESNPPVLVHFQPQEETTLIAPTYHVQHQFAAPATVVYSQEERIEHTKEATPPPAQVLYHYKESTSKSESESAPHFVIPNQQIQHQHHQTPALQQPSQVVQTTHPTAKVVVNTQAAPVAVVNTSVVNTSITQSQSKPAVVVTATTKAQVKEDKKERKEREKREKEQQKAAKKLQKSNSTSKTSSATTKMPMARLAEEEYPTEGHNDYNASDSLNRNELMIQTHHQQVMSNPSPAGMSSNAMGVTSRNVFVAPDCPIAWITVYLDKAEVCRCIRLGVSAGEISEIFFTKLSPSIDKDSIRVEVKGGNAATIQDVNFHARRQQEDEAQLSMAQYEIKEKIKNQKLHIDMLVAKQKRMEKQRVVLDTFADTLIEHKDGKDQAKSDISAARSLENGPVDAFDPKHMETLNSFFGMYENQAERLDEGIMNTKNDLEKSAICIKELEKTLKDVELRHDEQMSRELSVLLESRETTQVELYFSYVVHNVKWTPTYDMRIFNTDGTMKVVYYGMVQQATAEDWETAQLVLSTSQPGVGGTVPDLGIQRIHFKSSRTLPYNLPLSPTPTSPIKKNISRNSSTLRKSKRASAFEPADYVNAAPGTLDRSGEDAEKLSHILENTSWAGDHRSPPMSPSFRGPPMSPSFRGAGPQVQRGISVDSLNAMAGLPTTPQGTLKRESDLPLQSTQFEVPRPPSLIPCDNEGHRVTIAIIDLNPHFEYVSAPKRSPFAYLKANVQNYSKYAFLPGTTNIYVDNNFVGKSTIGAVAPNEDFSCFLGADHGIKVAYNPMFKYKETSGSGGKNAAVTFKQMIDIKNTHERAVKVLVMDQLPMSAEDKIKVTLLEPVIKHPEKYDKSKPVRINKANNVEWDLELQPGEVKELVLKYLVEHPVTEMVDVSFSEV